MRSCKEVVRILASNEELSLMARVELFLHLKMCKHCAKFSKQLAIMKQNFSTLFKKKTEVDQETLEVLKQDILKELQQ